MKRAALVASLVVVASAMGIASAGGPVAADRESSYPEGVANITHEPWQPKRGDDVRVTVRLHDDAAVPTRVSLLYCRVEPSYVCGLPFLLAAAEGGQRWSGSIEWNPRCEDDADDCAFMLEETRHIGYNITMHGDEDRRIQAPTGNFWVPETYPSDADGAYYFVRYDDAAATAPLPFLAAATAFLMALFWAVRRRW